MPNAELLLQASYRSLCSKASQSKRDASVRLQHHAQLIHDISSAEEWIRLRQEAADKATVQINYQTDSIIRKDYLKHDHSILSCRFYNSGHFWRQFFDQCLLLSLSFRSLCSRQFVDKSLLLSLSLRSSQLVGKFLLLTLSLRSSHFRSIF